MVFYVHCFRCYGIVWFSNLQKVKVKWLGQTLTRPGNSNARTNPASQAGIWTRSRSPLRANVIGFSRG
ncbi:hypothetical protein QWZ13_11645 [Reinekea marina]|uniref:hypothetical protein n=1 Tax=Reinekea marina TaxID=1310421 RepID=UPI0025B5D6A9|nr:hypothetical protein [Reinekea marina]MDN3649569.1 hypothetical protein [Reinekea marina]